MSEIADFPFLVADTMGAFTEYRPERDIDLSPELLSVMRTFRVPEPLLRCYRISEPKLDRGFDNVITMKVDALVPARMKQLVEPLSGDMATMVDDIDRVEKTPTSQLRELSAMVSKMIQRDLDRAFSAACYGLSRPMRDRPHRSAEDRAW